MTTEIGDFLKLIEIPEDVGYVSAWVSPDPCQWVAQFHDWQQYETGEYAWGVYDDCLVARQYIAYQVSQFLHGTDYEHVHAYRVPNGWAAFVMLVADSPDPAEGTGTTFVQAVSAAVKAQDAADNDPAFAKGVVTPGMFA